MAGPHQRKRAGSFVLGLGRSVKHRSCSPSPLLPEASASPQPPPSPTTGQHTISVASNTNTVHQKPPTAHRNHYDPAQNIMTKLEKALKGLQISASWCPPLASAAEGMLACMDLMQNATSTRDDFHGVNRLVDSLAGVVVDVEEHIKKSPMLRASDCVQNVARELQKEVENLKVKKDRRESMRRVEAMDDLKACYRRVELVFQRLQSNTILSVCSITHQNWAETKLKGMHTAKMARFDSTKATGVNRRACTPDTRITILEGLHVWADNIDSVEVYWINGMAGTGKTTISYTFCEELKQKHALGASFFCSHRLPDCRDASLIIPTIAYQLARFSHPYQVALCRVLEIDPDVGTQAVDVQFKKLLSEPLREVKNTMVAGKVIVVVDALDECAVQADVLEFINALFLYGSSLPVRFLVTCRPTLGLYEKLQSQYASLRSVLRLHDVEEAVVQRDIKRYLTAELTGVPNHTVERLAELCGRFFIFAATVVAYIKPHGGHLRQPRLDAIIGARWSLDDDMYQSIDVLYTAILSAALDDKESTKKEKAMTMQVLYTVICARGQLTTNALAGLLDIDMAQLELALEPLLPVLHVSQNDSLVSTLHASFPDYLLNKERSGKYFCDHDLHHTYLARRCLETMLTLLRFNICNLRTSYLLDEEVLDLKERIQRCIPSHLAYACRYLGEHIRRASSNDTLLSHCGEFLKTRMLYWIEVLNLLKCGSAGIATLEEVQKWLQMGVQAIHMNESMTNATNLSSGNEMSALLRDGHKFLNIISQHDVSRSTPHLYVSLFALWSKETPIWRYYHRLFRGLPWNDELAIGGDRSTDLVTPPISKHTTDCAGSSRLYSNSKKLRDFAPDGSRYALNESSGIYVRDLQTGKILSGPYSTSNGRHHRSDSFSYNGKWIATVSDEPEIVLWNTHTDNRPSYLPKFEQSTTMALALSPGDLLLVSQKDGYSSIWCLCTLTRQTLIELGARSLSSAAWSPDSSQLAATDRSGVIGIWNTFTGQKIFETIKNRGWQDFQFAQYSHSGTYIALVSKSELFIWDASTGRKLVGPLATCNSFSTLVFTPDDKYVVLYGTETRVWETHTGEIVVGPFKVPWNYEWRQESQIITFTQNDHLTHITPDLKQFE